MSLLPDTQLSLMSKFNQPNIKSKSCVWTTKYNRPLDMCSVQQGELKSEFTFQSKKKRLVCTNKKCIDCCHVSKIPFKTKIQQLCCVAVMVHIALQERPVATTIKQTFFPFLKFFIRQLQSSTHKFAPKKEKNHSLYGIIVSTPQWVIQVTKTSFPFSFSTLSVYSKAT